MSKTYLIKRLRDSGYIVDKIDSLSYSENDSRKWSALIDARGTNIIVTLYKDGTTSFYDGEQYTTSLTRHNFETVEEYVFYLHERGIINKHFTYGNRKVVNG